MELDLDKIRKEVESEQGPEWVKKYGDASWDAAMAGDGGGGPMVAPPVTRGQTRQEPAPFLGQ